MPRKIFLEGKKIDNLTILRYVGKIENMTNCYEVICDCGNKRMMRTSQILSKWNDKTIKSCGMCRPHTQPPYLGYRGLSGAFLAHIKYSANKRKIEFAVSKEYLWNLYIQQNQKCALTGININMPLFKRQLEKREYNISLDRIDSSKGYIEGNVQWVTKEVNYMKRSLSQKEFINVCYNVIKHQNKNANLSL